MNAGKMQICLGVVVDWRAGVTGELQKAFTGQVLKMTFAPYLSYVIPYLLGEPTLQHE